MNLAPYVFQWAKDQCLDISELNSLIGGKVYRSGEAPPEAQRPFLEIGAFYAPDLATMNGVRIYTDVRFDVVVRMPSESPNTDPLGGMVEIMSYVYQALNRTSGGITGAWIDSCKREAEIGPRADPDHFLILGGTFRAQARPDV